MSKLTLSDPANLVNSSAIATIAANNRAIEAALENTLSRDGSTPNTMGADLDMNGNQILNLPAATTSTEPVRKAEYDTLVALVNADPNSKAVSIAFVIDGGGLVLTPGMKGYVEVPFECTLERYTLLPDVSGSVSIDVWKCAYADFNAGTTHPVVADSITGANPAVINASTKAQDTALSGWTTFIAAGSILAFYVNSATTIKRVTLSLRATKP